jgi:hypothetical protein
MAVYWNDKKCEPSDTPLSIGLSDQEVNQLDIFRVNDPNLNTIHVKWQLKDHRPVMRRIKRVSEQGRKMDDSTQLSPNGWHHPGS